MTLKPMSMPHILPLHLLLHVLRTHNLNTVASRDGFVNEMMVIHGGCRSVATVWRLEVVIVVLDGFATSTR
jgi:hypothetical protein